VQDTPIFLVFSGAARGSSTIPSAGRHHPQMFQDVGHQSINQSSHSPSSAFLPSPSARRPPLATPSYSCRHALAARHLQTSRCHPLAAIWSPPFTRRRRAPATRSPQFTHNHPLAAIRPPPFTRRLRHSIIRSPHSARFCALTDIQSSPSTRRHLVAAILWPPSACSHPLTAAIHSPP